VLGGAPMRLTKWIVLVLALSLSGCAVATDPSDDVVEDEDVGTSEEALVVRDVEWQFFAKMNQARVNHGLKRLKMQPGLVRIARAWSAHMEADNALSHRGNLSARIDAVVTKNWSAWGENVGVGSDVAGLHRAFMQSDAHRHNVLGRYDYVGIGVVRDGSQIWVTFDFLRSSATLATRTAP
jgi:uncharacterized protein YkwD